MGLSKAKTVGLILFSALFGIVAEGVFLGGEPVTTREMLGFPLLMPTFVALYLLLLRKTKWEKKGQIIGSSIGLFILIYYIHLALVLHTEIFVRTVPGEVLVIVLLWLFAGIIAAPLVGCLYGLYLYYSVQQQRQRIDRVMYPIHGAVIGLAISLFIQHLHSNTLADHTFVGPVLDTLSEHIIGIMFFPPVSFILGTVIALIVYRLRRTNDIQFAASK